MRSCGIRAWYKAAKEQIVLFTTCSTSPDSTRPARLSRAKMASLVMLPLTCLVLTSALAQTVYRSVDASGRVTFSDLPPSNTSQVTPLGSTGDGGPQNPGLPYELRVVTGKYPVTLYTSPDCTPCEDGRSLLRSRGVPFTEKTISKPEDAESLKRMSSATSLPLLTIGAQQLKGFAASEWNQYLSVAGYPETSKLPTGYRNPAPTPLVALQSPVVPAAAASAAPAPIPPRPIPPAAPNPAGIQF